MSELLTKESVIDLLKSGIPDAEWLLSQIESEQGWFRFPPYLTNLITNLKIENYPLLYQNESAIGVMMFKGFLNDEQLKELDAELSNASPEERAEFLEAFRADLDANLEGFEIPKTPAAQEAAKERFEALNPEEQKQSVRISQHFFCSFFASFYQLLSIMVHGEKLTSLVAQAIAGDDKAFAKAIQIDRRILTAIPYFKERFARAQDEANSDFYDDLSYRLKTPPYRGKIRYKSLWLVFAVLDMAKLLDSMSVTEVREVCDEIRLDKHESRIKSDKHLARRIKEYREFQKRGIVTTT